MISTQITDEATCSFARFIGKTLVNLTIAPLIALTFMSPGRLFRFFHEANFIWFNLEYFWIFLAFGFILACCRSIRTVIVVFLLVGILEFTQFGSLAYFGEFINPYAIGQMFTEIGDVSKVVVSSVRHLFYVPLIIIIPYGLMILIIRMLWPYQLKVRFFTVLIVLFFIYPATRIHYQVHSDRRKDMISYFPVASTPSVGNTLNSYSIWLTYLLPRSFFPKERPSFLPIHVEKKVVEDQITVVLVMGESQTCQRMSLFGFERETTPRLDALKFDPNFVFKKGYSAAIATRATMPMFYNIQYNPLNQDILKYQSTNMFNLARDSGFQTIYISAQNANCLNGVNIHAIDHFFSYETSPHIFDQLHDDALLVILSKIPLKQRNFIVLHQRNPHAPYEANYSNHKELIRFPTEGLPYQEYMKNAYDNAVLYNDFLYDSIIHYLKSKVDGPVYLFITSDHGEEFGEQGLWGHDHLTYGSALVPILFYNMNGDGHFHHKFKLLQTPTHYELELLIADRLGYIITDPNREQDWFHINGVAVTGMSGYMKFRKSSSEIPAELLVF